MGLIAATLGLRTPTSPAVHSHPAEPIAAPATSKRYWDRFKEAAAKIRPEDLPDLPQWEQARAPLPTLDLVNAGMRPITGGRRRSF
jgi:hypothetical protein